MQVTFWDRSKFFDFGQDQILGQSLNLPLAPLLVPERKTIVHIPVFWDKKKTAKIIAEAEYIVD